MIHQAVILAAGEGKRMKKTINDPSIINIPKPLLKITNIAIIEHSIKNLSTFGIDIAVIINPKDEKVFRENLKEYDIKYYYQREPLGTANALYSAKDFIKDDYFLVMMGDDLSNFNFEEMLYTDHPVIYGYEVDDLSRFGAIMIDSKGRAYDVIEKKQSGRGLANTGVYIMPKYFFEEYSKIDVNKESGEFYLPDTVRRMYNLGSPFEVRMMYYWSPINDANDLNRTVVELSKFDYLSLKIKKARFEDLPSLLDILYQLSPLEQLEAIKRNNIYESFSNIIKNDDYYLMVAEIDGKLVGTATLLIQQNLTHHGRPYGHIENVVTDYKFQGLGIGCILVKYLIGIARLRNCYKIILNCNEKNVEFYQKCGFMKTEELEMRINL